MFKSKLSLHVLEKLSWRNINLSNFNSFWPNSPSC